MKGSLVSLLLAMVLWQGVLKNSSVNSNGDINLRLVKTDRGNIVVEAAEDKNAMNEPCWQDPELIYGDGYGRSVNHVQALWSYAVTEYVKSKELQ